MKDLGFDCLPAKQGCRKQAALAVDQFVGVMVDWPDADAMKLADVFKTLCQFIDPGGVEVLPDFRGWKPDGLNGKAGVFRFDFLIGCVGHGDVDDSHMKQSKP
jgi:hypothetical protein